MFSANQIFTNYHDYCNASSQGICNALGKSYGSLYISEKPPPTPPLSQH